MRKIKNGLILAGGDSTRFWPLEEKNFFSFLGKPLILYQVEQLSQYCEALTVVANQSNAVIIKRLLENSDLKIKYQVIVQKDISGQAGAILSAKNLVRGETLIINANDLINFTILNKIIKFPVSENKIIFFGKKINEYFPGGYFRFDSKNKLQEIVEKPDKDKMPSSIYNLVVHYYSNIDNLIKTIESVKSTEDNHYELAINQLFNSPIDRDYFIYEDYWQSLKYPWHVLSMMKIFLSTIKENKISRTAIISKNTIIVPPVIIEENVKIGDFSKIVGPTFIDDNSIVGDYALIRESQIGQDSLIGSFTEVARSYIGNRVFLHRNYIGDSVLADEVMIGAQAVAANLKFNEKTVFSNVGEERLDTGLTKFGTIVGKESKIGVNATILPGVKIGKKTWIGPEEVVSHDLKDKVYLDNGNEKVNLKV